EGRLLLVEVRSVLDELAGTVIGVVGLEGQLDERALDARLVDRRDDLDRVATIPPIRDRRAPVADRAEQIPDLPLVPVVPQGLLRRRDRLDLGDQIGVAALRGEAAAIRALRDDLPRLDRKS